MYFDHGVTGYFVPLCTANNQSEIITAHVTVGSMEKMPKAACCFRNGVWPQYLG